MDRTSSPEIMNNRNGDDNQKSCICEYLCIPLYTFCVNCWKEYEDIIFDGPPRQPEIHESTLPNQRHESTIIIIYIFIFNNTNLTTNRNSNST
jgi:hypothetical protein